MVCDPWHDEALTRKPESGEQYGRAELPFASGAACRIPNETGRLIPDPTKRKAFGVRLGRVGMRERRQPPGQVGVPSFRRFSPKTAAVSH